MNERRTVHTYFGLTYANFLVMHRTLMQAMPEEWQDKFVRLLDEYDESWAHLNVAHGFRVQTGEWLAAEDLSKNERETYGIVDSLEKWGPKNPEPEPSEYEDDDAYSAVYELWANERDAQYYDLQYFDGEGYGSDVTNEKIFVHAADTVDHYRRPQKYTPFGNSGK